MNADIPLSPASLEAAFPLIGEMAGRRPVFWENPNLTAFHKAEEKISLTANDTMAAEQRLARWAPFLSLAFPDTAPAGGKIESPLKPAPALKDGVSGLFGNHIPGRLMLKLDSRLPVSGSVKARGGIYEVLKHAEELALAAGLVSIGEDYSCFYRPEFRAFFSKYAIAVGSTGNLGLSIGITGAALGFRVFVHMSADARGWKKAVLRDKGVTVVEVASDYSRAVAEGRRQAEDDPSMHFVDDENSRDLFLGYATAGNRLKRQLDAAGIRVDGTHPLFVYLPCGVGGGPGGITLGLKQAFGDHAHCFFAEPVASPCMLLGMMTGLHEKISVRDIGLDNVTDADGLAVARPSGFVGRTLAESISGLFTVRDTTLYQFLALTAETENIRLEPSALAGLPGPWLLQRAPEGQGYIQRHGLDSHMDRATHVVWATGGALVPETEMNEYLARASSNRYRR